MRRDQKQKTSVFSEYENNENDSITSRQLEFWLKQTAPMSQPRPANEWTLMSTHSIYEEDEHPLHRNQTFQSINKENDMTAFNSLRQPFQNTSSVAKSKSYLNAMTDLQSKVKQLEQQNGNLKNTLNFFKQDRNRSMSESSFATQELKNRISILEPKAKKLEEMVKQNKKLRDWRQENMRKIKILEKIIKEHGDIIVIYEKQIENLKTSEKGLLQLKKQSDERYQQQLKFIEKLKGQNAKLIQKNKALEDMKEKSTSSVLEKYSKSVNQIQLLTHQNNNLRKQMALQKTKFQQKYKQTEEENRRQRQQLLNSNERLKQQNIQKKQLIVTLNNQICYFKENYQKINESLICCIKDHSKEIQELKERQVQLKMKLQYREMQAATSIQPQKDQIYISKESIIKSNHNYEHEMNNKNQIQSQLQFEEFNSIEPEEAEEPPQYETRSVIQNQPKKSVYSKSQIKNKPNDTLSQENYHEPLVIKPILKKAKHKSQEIKDKTASKQKQRSQQQIKSKEKSRERSKEKSREKDKINQEISHEHSFIVKSHEPLTHKEIPEHMYYTQEPGFNSTNNKKNVPYYWESNDFAEFGISQRASQHNCVHNPLTTQFKLEQAMLNEINRQGLRLLEAQLRYMESDKDQNLTPSQKAEHFGRLKQISEQIRINFEKQLQLKQIINGK